MGKLRWGVLSTSNFARNKILPALQLCRHAEFTAIASRDLARAQAVVDQVGCGKAYGSYEELLVDPEIDVIYNPLPNHLHVPWSIKAIEAGKHVLCEKPIGMSAAEAQQLLDTVQRHPHLKAMEAFVYRFHPQWQYARQAVNDGSLGEVRTIHAAFSYFNTDGANIRNQWSAGGGGLMDIGCYNISLARFIFGTEPKRALAVVENDPGFHTDRLVSGILDFGSGTAVFTCSTQLVWFQRVIILGTAGRIEFEVPFNARPEKPAKLWHQRGDRTDEVQFEICNQYTIQADEFSLAVMNDAPVPTPLADAVANMKVIDAVRESGKKNSWVAIS